MPAAMPISPASIQNLLENQDSQQLERLAQAARKTTRQYFGRAIGLYTPLYLSNYCSSHCVYCGFHSHHPIKRVKLSAEETDREMSAIAGTGIQNILLLTGESPQATPLDYLKNAVKLARKYFQGISLEIYPLDEAGYRELYLEGAEGITIYQETYDRSRYGEVHLAGQKTDYDFRRNAPARIARGGMRQISLGILLGLGPLAEDLYALYNHLREMEQAFPGIEYSLSFPRLRTINSQNFAGTAIDDTTMIKILCLTRLLFPRTGINLSTRESAEFRNHALEIAVSRISVGSRTTVGGYLESSRENAPQFDIADERDAKETLGYLRNHGFDPVFTDWRRIANT